MHKKTLQKKRSPIYKKLIKKIQKKRPVHKKLVKQIKCAPKKKEKKEKKKNLNPEPEIPIWKPTGPRIAKFKNFLNYEQIRIVLNKMLQTYPSNLEMEILGDSKEGRPIFLMFIARNVDHQRKNAIFIEAGSNGEDLVTVASALYIINYLCAHAPSSTTLRIMDVFVLPCSNPDAYERSLYGVKNPMNLARSYPFRLAHCNIDDIGIEKYLEAARKWKENLKFQNNEKLAIIKGIADYQFSIKLFISLQQEGHKILYPFGTKYEVDDVDALAYVAQIGRLGSEMDFRIGSIYHLCGLTFGTVIDFLKLFSKYLKYTYIIHMHDKRKGQPFRKVPYLAENVLCVVTLMAKEVENYYTTQDFYPYKIEENEAELKRKRIIIKKYLT